MNTYIARQPIFDKNMQIFAYELLFRNNEVSDGFSDTGGDIASSRIIMDSFQAIGIDSLTNRKPAFINFTSTLLLEGIATLFPKELLVIEILETVDPTPEVISVCRNLNDMGYTLALDDFVYRPELEPLIDICKIIKFDFLSTDPDEIEFLFQKLDLSDKHLLAEKVETQEMFRFASEIGFTLFQGYFFSKPVTMTSRNVAPMKLNYLSLIAEIKSGDDLDFDNISSVIRRDVALCHKLLRMVNSAYYGLNTEITDIKHALTLLGTKEIRKWIYLMSLMEINPEKPNELIRMSLIRGYFIEQFNAVCGLGFPSENAFITGLFSLIDVMKEQTMYTALSDMALPLEVSDALIENEGTLYSVLRLVINIERGKWENADNIAKSFGVSVQTVSDIYLQAVKWCAQTAV